MIHLFSSAEATAVANILVFAGILLAAWRIGRAWASRFLANFSSGVRRVQQTQLLAELKKTREYRSNKAAALRDAAYGSFDDLAANVSVLSAVTVIAFIFISVTANSDTQGDKGTVWTEIYADHVYWVSIFTGIFSILALVGIALLWGMRANLRFLRFAADPEASRRQLIERYLKLRSLR